MPQLSSVIEVAFDYEKSLKNTLNKNLFEIKDIPELSIEPKRGENNGSKESKSKELIILPKFNADYELHKHNVEIFLDKKVSLS